MIWSAVTAVTAFTHLQRWSRRLAVKAATAVAALQIALPLSAQLLTSTPSGVVVAHNSQLRLHNGWTADGVEHPTSIASSDEQVAVLDALNNEAVIADLRTGRTTRIDTAETPIAAAFLGRELYVLARDARVLQHGPTRIPLAADPAFLRIASGRLYVYSRVAGVLEEIERDRVTRRIRVAPFASDFEISGTTGYLAYPRDARIRTVDLQAMKASGEIAVGAVPTDLAFAGGGTALTARILAIADPSAKRVWLTESTQSMTEAVARGVLRGVLGLGLFGDRASQFPTGVDRVVTRGKQWIAYDSSSGTLYHFTSRKSSVVAKGVAPGAYTLTGRGVAWWNGMSVAEKVLQ
ncbi:MAG: hypothetical protein QOJ98_3161 [Acidobacteriota bacterium]|nr:hypothetical protein [Acidobacteriota bacterium]